MFQLEASVWQYILIFWYIFVSSMHHAKPEPDVPINQPEGGSTVSLLEPGPVIVRPTNLILQLVYWRAELAIGKFGFSKDKDVIPNGHFSSSNSTPREDTADCPVMTFPASLNANVIDVEKGKNDLTLHVESNAAVPSSSKVPFVSRILPISRKSSQVVPSHGYNDQSSVVSIEVIPGSEIITTTEVELHSLKSSSPDEKKMSESRAHNSPIVVTVEPKDEAFIETGDDVCRICHDNPSRMTLLSPCLCKGSMGKVHRTCLERWLGESAKTSCEICGHEYETERRPRYKGWRSIVAWIRHPLNPTDTRNFFFDLACFFVLTPLAAISAWLCVTLDDATVDANPYHEDKTHHIPKLHNKSVEASNATWTSIGLLTLTGTLLAAYYVWLFVAVRYHIQVWRDWQARNYVVTISPLNAEVVQKLRELREASAHTESETADQRQNQPEVPTESNLTPSFNNSANNNNNTSSDNSGSESMRNGKTESALKEKSLLQKHKASSLQGTDLDELDAIKMEIESNRAGPSCNCHCNNNNDSACNSFRGKGAQIPPEVDCSSKEFQNHDSNKH
ncbi:unnamed protein product [Allacma fusca]|uniref:RING-CH-type domain-containing protein n=1 Tax=Allacma fusca TaxID=39272 RepID=A0A8J2LFJ2_9HEXA|nr:unnamed protein product [Allacma fusca]